MYTYIFSELNIRGGQDTGPEYCILCPVFSRVRIFRAVVSIKRQESAWRTQQFYENKGFVKILTFYPCQNTYFFKS